MSNNTELSVEERLNLATGVIERQRKQIEELERDKNELQFQLNQSNKGMIDIINSNVELKEQNQALIAENNEMVSTLAVYDEKIKSYDLIATAGMHLAEAIKKIDELNELNKK